MKELYRREALQRKILYNQVNLVAFISTLIFKVYTLNINMNNYENYTKLLKQVTAS